MSEEITMAEPTVVYDSGLLSTKFLLCAFVCVAAVALCAYKLIDQTGLIALCIPSLTIFCGANVLQKSVTK